MPRMFMALRKEDRTPIVEIMARTPEIPETCQWAIFLRNHDELTLEMVTDEERDYMYREYAGDSRMRINVGIRRRLAPLMDNGRRQIELMNALLMSMPGTPIVYYGDELGMGDNVYLGDRNGVRTPMQWSDDKNAGFSEGDSAALYSPLIVDPPYGYHGINVEAAERTKTSLLRWMRRLIGVRKKYRAFGRGTFEVLHPTNRAVLVFIRRHDNEIILCVNNLSRYAQAVELDLSEFQGCVPVELWGERPFPAIGELPYLLTPGPHSVFWFRIARPETVQTT
jgi:maltose alpha-D-glucosyltransferase/alpha-amylase